MLFNSIWPVAWACVSVSWDHLPNLYVLGVLEKLLHVGVCVRYVKYSVLLVTLHLLSTFDFSRVHMICVTWYENMEASKVFASPRCLVAKRERIDMYETITFRVLSELKLCLFGSGSTMCLDTDSFLPHCHRVIGLTSAISLRVSLGIVITFWGWFYLSVRARVLSETLLYFNIWIWKECSNFRHPLAEVNSAVSVDGAQTRPDAATQNIAKYTQ